MSTKPHAAALSAEIALLPAPVEASQTVEHHDGWTPAKQGAFLRALGASHNDSAAAKSVGMSRQSAYRLRNRLKGEPFDVAWACAFRRTYDALADAALSTGRSTGSRCHITTAASWSALRASSTSG